MSSLSPGLLGELRDRLEGARDAALALLDQTVADSRPVDLGLPIGRLTRIDAIQMQAMAQLNRRQLEVRLQQVDLALQLMADGRYGVCRHCKEPIRLERLRPIPETPFCVDCQERFERER